MLIGLFGLLMKDPFGPEQGLSFQEYRSRQDTDVTG